MLCSKPDNTLPDKVLGDRFLDSFSLHILMGRINLYSFNTEIYMTTVLSFFAMRCPKSRLIILQQHHNLTLKKLHTVLQPSALV